MRFAPRLCSFVTSTLLLIAGPAQAQQSHLLPSEADAGVTSTPQQLPHISSPSFGHPTLKSTGRIVGFNKFGLVVEENKNSQTLYLCCYRSTVFEAKKHSALEDRDSLLYADFQVGDKVDVFYEPTQKVVKKLRLVKREKK